VQAIEFIQKQPFSVHCLQELYENGR